MDVIDYWFQWNQNIELRVDTSEIAAMMWLWRYSWLAVIVVAPKTIYNWPNLLCAEFFSFFFFGLFILIVEMCFLTLCYMVISLANVSPLPFNFTFMNIFMFVIPCCQIVPLAV